MAKKKNVEPKEEEDELSELEDDSLEDLDDESIFPDVEKKPVKTDLESEPVSEEGEEEEEEYEEDLNEEMVKEIKDYKFVKPSIIKKTIENDYELVIKGQSHGFCNLLVKHLLDTDGVNLAAYKITNIADPKVFLRIQEDYEIKDIIRNGISSLQKEVTATQKVFQKLM